MAAEIRGERAASNLTIEQLSTASGVPLSTLKRILKGDIDVNVADLGAIAAALSEATEKPVTPQEFMKRAVQRAGGYEVLSKES
jgi:predicted transcriptional regulator